MASLNNLNMKVKISPDAKLLIHQEVAKFEEYIQSHASNLIRKVEKIIEESITFEVE